MSFETMTYEDFYLECIRAKEKYPEWRWGQTLFNIGFQVKPQLVSEMQQVGIDPFYVGSDARGRFVIDQFLSHLHEFWDAPLHSYGPR